MPLALTLLLVVAVVLPDPLVVEVAREPAAVEVEIQLPLPLPEEQQATLASGAEVRIAYPIRIKAKRRTVWDKRLWAGELITIAAFDPVTGRHRCQVILDGVITSSGEVESTEAAERWLTQPPPVRIELPEDRRGAALKVRVRAVFSRGTTWLIFPTQEASPWVEIDLESPAEPPDTSE
ncbi:MAG: hypothetical protein V2I67_04930 [Thermoanaerobaculales bacterium]|jgi:hypothetical protein|nr:hypothetical protein [Thermoanaerobaculales bacterium]